MEIFFVRHGQSTANVTGHWQGHGDSQLSDAGREQATALAKRLEAERFDLVLSSDLSRAADTGRALGRELELEPRFREVDVGAWEGLTRPEVMQRFPENILDLRAGKPVKIGGGESWDEMHARATEALDELVARLDEDGRAIVFSHGGVIASLFAGFIDARDQVMGPLGRVDNTAIQAVHISDAGRRISRFNDSSHRGSVGHYAAEALEDGARIARLLSGDMPAKGAAPENVSARSDRADAIAAEAERAVDTRPGRFVPPPTGTRTDLLHVKDRTFLVAYAASTR